MSTWEIFTYGNGELLAWIFNGITAIMGDGNFNTLIRLAGVFGILWVIFRAAFFQARQADWGWFIAFIFIYGALFVPKTSVTIVDRLQPSATRTVANVPVGLAAFAGTMSHIGDWMTRAAEAVFTLPNDLKYQQSGAVFSARLLSAAREFRITDPDLTANMEQFMKQCVAWDLLLRHYTWRDLLEAPDPWAFIQANTSQLRRFDFTCYTPKGGSALPGCSHDGEVLTPVCRTGANGILQQAWTRELNNAAAIYGRRIFPSEISGSIASARLLGVLPVAYDYLGQISSSGQKLMQGNMIANIFKRSLSHTAASSDAPAAAQELATVQAEERQRDTYAMLGHLMAKWLPLMRNLYEAIIYGMFPFVFLLFLTPWGFKVAGGYFKNIVWLQLWPPIYAVLNLAMTLNQQKSTLALVGDPINGLPLALQPGLGDIASDTAILAGYMTLSIPLIAYGLVTGGQMALTQLASQIGSVAQASAARSADIGATGNVSMGNLSLENKGMFRNTTSPVTDYGRYSYTDPRTGATMEGGQEVAALSAMKSNVSVRADVTSSLMHSARRDVQEATSHVSSATTNYVNKTASTMNQAMDFHKATSRSHEYGDMWSSGRGAKAAETLATLESFAHTLTDKYHFSESEADQIVSRISAGLSAGIGIEDIISANISGSITGDHISSEELAQLVDDIQSSVSSKDLREATDFIHDHLSQSQSSDRYGFDAGLAKQYQSSYQSMVDSQNARSEALQKLEQATKSASIVKNLSTGTHSEYFGMLYNDLIGIYGRDTVNDLFATPGRLDEQQAVVESWVKRMAAHQTDLQNGTMSRADIARLAWQDAHSPGHNTPGFTQEVADRVDGHGADRIRTEYQQAARALSQEGRGEVVRTHHENNARVSGPGPNSAAAAGFSEADLDAGRLPNGMDANDRDLRLRTEKKIEEAGLKVETEGPQQDQDKVKSKVGYKLTEGEARVPEGKDQS